MTARWSNLALVGAFLLGSLVQCDREQASAAPPAKPEPRCLRERKMHAYGTYQTPPSAGGFGGDHRPIDLTIAECLEWEVKP